MLRMNIGTPPTFGPGQFQQASLELEAVQGDPFAQAPSPLGAEAAPQASPDPSTVLRPTAPGARAPLPHPELEAVQGDPFQLGPGPAQVRGPGQDTMLGALTGTNPPTYDVGDMGLGQPDASAIPAPGAPVPGEQTLIQNRGNPSFWDVLRDRSATFDPVAYSVPDQPIPGQAPDLQFQPPALEAPPQPSAVPDFSAELAQSYTPANREPDPYRWGQGVAQDTIEAVRNRVMAAPVGTGREPQKGDGTTVGNPAPGSVSFDPRSGDQFGGHASASALAAASLIPLTSAENLHKRVLIYARDLNVPPDRFFTDPDGTVKWVDLKGQVFSVAPTMGGGDLLRAPVDMVSRGVTQGLANAGEIGVNVAGAVGGMVGGNGPAARLLGGMAGAATAAAGADIARQAAGNMAAERAGYVRPPELGPSRLGIDALDIDWLNVGGQAIQNAGFEAFARTIPLLLNGFVPASLFGTNPYRLNKTELQDLAYILAHDAKTGGHILKRAQAADELGLPLTPADLLQVTDGMGMSAGYAESHERLMRSFQQLETTLANRTGTMGAGAAGWMQNFYRARQAELFPAAVDRMLQKIHPGAEFSPKEGFVQFQRAARNIVARLEEARLGAGMKSGWGELFQMGLNADTRAVRQHVHAALDKAAGRSRDELKGVLRELEEPATFTQGGKTVQGTMPVTDFERLHNARLDVRSRIDELAGTGKTDAETAALRQLRKVDDLLTSELRRNPLYAAGDDAFQEASRGLDDAKQGLLSLLTENPLYQEQLGGALAEAGPTKIAAAKKLFQQFGLGDAWNAHTRAYLQHSLQLAGRRGQEIGDDFYRQVASTPELRAGLREMAPDARTGELLDQLLSAGHAMDARAAGTRRTAPGVRVNTARLSPGSGRNRDIFDATVSPLRYGLGKTLGRDNYLADLYREAGSQRTAVNMTSGAGSAYQNMRQTSLPLAGATGEALERAAYLSADPLNEITDMIPRASPEWLLKIALPYLRSPPQLDPTAPDLVPQGMFNRLLGAAPR